MHPLDSYSGRSMAQLLTDAKRGNFEELCWYIGNLLQLLLKVFLGAH